MRCNSKPSSDILTSVSYHLHHQPAKSIQPMLAKLCEAPNDGDEYDRGQVDRLVTEDESDFHSCFRPSEFVSAPCKSFAASGRRAYNGSGVEAAPQ